jgi:hypothetical protein
MVDPITLLTLVSAGVSIFQGVQKRKSMFPQAEDAEGQAIQLFAERRRDANLIRRDGDIFAQRQALAYVGAGVKIGGSALITLEHTRRMAGAEADAVERRGKAEFDLTRTNTRTARSEGNASLISGFLNAGSMLAGLKK